jgi:DNA-binding NarL/FixJ family response regulator
MDNQERERGTPENNRPVLSAVNVLIADDHKIIRDGMKMVLNSVNNNEYNVFEADSYESAITLITSGEVSIDVAFVDYRMGAVNGDELVRYLALKHPEIKTVGISNYDETAYVIKMVHAGAKGYVLKNIGVEELQLCIEKVLSGKRYFSEEIKDKLDDTREASEEKAGEEVAEQAESAVKGKERISEREIQIVRLIAKELTNEEIAETLNVSKRTVDNQRMNLMQRINVRNTAGLVRWAFQKGLIE